MLRIDSHTDGLRLDDGVETFDKIKGTSGADTLTGTDGDDKIDGAAGDDYLSGAAGDDSILGGKGNDHLEGDGGNDTLDGGIGNDTIFGSAGDVVAIGGDGLDIVNFFFSSSGVHVSLALQGEAQDTGIGSYTLSGVEGLVGTLQSDVLIGDDSNNSIWTNKGFDTVSGAGGDDLLLTGLDAGGIFDGGSGVDTLRLATPFATNLSLSIKGPQDFGGSQVTLKNIENLSAFSSWESNDTFSGDKGANILAGAKGDDHLVGQAGDDTLAGDGSIDGDFSSALNLNVGSGFDTLEGGLGDDILIGGLGSDQLQGGAGNDSFVFMAVDDSPAGAADLITDLNRKDSIDLSAIDANSTAHGDQAFHIVKAFTGHAGELVRSYDAGADLTHFLMDVDGDGSADMEIQASGDQHGFASFVL